MSGQQRPSRAQVVADHLRAGRDYEQAADFHHARQHYTAALQRATKSERPAIEEALARLATTTAGRPWLQRK